MIIPEWYNAVYRADEIRKKISFSSIEKETIIVFRLLPADKVANKYAHTVILTEQKFDNFIDSASCSSESFSFLDLRDKRNIISICESFQKEIKTRKTRIST